MKAHDILGISCFASEEEIEKAYLKKLNAVSEMQSSFGYNELAENKKKTLNNAKNECLAYRTSNIKSRAVMEIKESSRNYISPGRLYNCFPCGLIAVLGNICEPFKKWEPIDSFFGDEYFDFCVTCDSDRQGDCCNDLCMYDCCYGIIGILDFMLWALPFVGIGALCNFLEKREKTKKERDRQNEIEITEKRHKEYIKRAKNLEEEINKFSSEKDKLVQDISENGTNLERAKADFDAFYKRVIGFVQALELDIDVTKIPKSICINEYKKELNRLEAMSKKLHNDLKHIDGEIKTRNDELQEIKNKIER